MRITERLSQRLIAVAIGALVVSGGALIAPDRAAAAAVCDAERTALRHAQQQYDRAEILYERGQLSAATLAVLLSVVQARRHDLAMCIIGSIE